MTIKNIKLLFLITVVLGAIFIWQTSSQDRGSSSGASENKLLSDIDVRNLSSITIKQGDKSIKLSYEGDSWVLPEKGNYLLDRGKLNSLFLKLFDISTSQKLSVDKKFHESYGVSENDKTGNATEIELYAGASKITSVILGKQRKANKKVNQRNAQGQYVRRGDSPQVYLSEPIVVDTSLISWIDTSVLNILSSKIVEIKQEKYIEGQAKEVFTLKRKEDSFVYEGKVPTGKQLSEANVTQVKSGLENFRLKNVLEKDSDEVKNLTFTEGTHYTLENGNIYLAKTAQREGDYFVALDALNSENSSDEELDKANARLSPWVFEVEEFQGKKLTLTLDKLFEEPPAAKPEVESAEELPSESVNP